MDYELSAKLANQFLDLFNVPLSHISFFSNYGWNVVLDKREIAGFGVGGATFDIALIGLTKDRIGFFLAEDED